MFGSSSLLLRTPSRRMVLLPSVLALVALAVAGFSGNRLAAQEPDEGQPKKTVIVVRDFRLIERETFVKLLKVLGEDPTEDEIERRYALHVVTVRSVQSEQFAVIHSAMRRYGVSTLFIEGVPKGDLEEHQKTLTAWADSAASIDLLQAEYQTLRQELATRAANGDTGGDYAEKNAQLPAMQQKIMAFGMQQLRLGAAAYLQTADGLELKLAALDSAESLELQHPDKPAELAEEIPTPEDVEARETIMAKEIAEWLKQHDTAILLLSGDHDLRDSLRAEGAEVQYGAATVRSFPK